MWVKPCLGRRINLGLYETLVQELRFKDKSEYKKLLRMTPQDFGEILRLVQDDVNETNTNMRDSIPANTRVCVSGGKKCSFLGNLACFVFLKHSF